MKKLLFLLLLSFSTLMLSAQGMSDQQVMQFIQREVKAGTSQSQIVTKLMQKGVKIDQIRRLRQQYDKQISERGADGKKHVIRKSEFSRGNKIIVTGIRDGQDFRAKKYKNTKFHLIETIAEVNGNDVIINNKVLHIM